MGGSVSRRRGPGGRGAGRCDGHAALLGCWRRADEGGRRGRGAAQGWKRVQGWRVKSRSPSLAGPVASFEWSGRGGRASEGFVGGRLPLASESIKCRTRGVLSSSSSAPSGRAHALTEATSRERQGVLSRPSSSLSSPARPRREGQRQRVDGGLSSQPALPSAWSASAAQQDTFVSSASEPQAIASSPPARGEQPVRARLSGPSTTSPSLSPSALPFSPLNPPSHVGRHCCTTPTLSGRGAYQRRAAAVVPPARAPARARPGLDPARLVAGDPVPPGRPAGPRRRRQAPGGRGRRRPLARRQGRARV